MYRKLVYVFCNVNPFDVLCVNTIYLGVLLKISRDE